MNVNMEANCKKQPLKAFLKGVKNYFEADNSRLTNQTKNVKIKELKYHLERSPL